MKITSSREVRTVSYTSTTSQMVHLKENSHCSQKWFTQLNLFPMVINQSSCRLALKKEVLFVYGVSIRRKLLCNRDTKIHQNIKIAMKIKKSLMMMRKLEEFKRHSKVTCLGLAISITYTRKITSKILMMMKNIWTQVK